VAVKPQKGTFTYADWGTVPQHGDIIMIVASEDESERFATLD
jgi:hypothetical protein